MKDAQLMAHLLDCAEEPLRQALCKEGHGIEEADETTILTAVKNLAVRNIL